MAPVDTAPWLDEQNIRFMLEECETWAVVGLSGDPSRTAYRIAKLLQDRGKRIVPVHPSEHTVLGEDGLRGFRLALQQVSCQAVGRVVGLQAVEVRHLMGHTAGLSGWEEPMEVTDLWRPPCPPSSPPAAVPRSVATTSWPWR